MDALQNYPDLDAVVEVVCDTWPEHRKYCAASAADLSDGELATANRLAGLVQKLGGNDIPGYCADYRWMCERFLEEELYFRRNGNYRLKTFDEAFQHVYDNSEYMSRYVRGILISQLIWTAHARAFHFFINEFLTSIKPGSRYLEVGPGHGLFLYHASQSERVGELEAWDVSSSSITATRHALAQLGVSRPIELTLQDVLQAPPVTKPYDAIVISEVLEHLEEPQRALSNLRSAMTEDAKIYINFPINSPAPDHIYLLRSAEEVEDLVREAGLRVERHLQAPMTGQTLEKAVKNDLSISSLVIASRDDGGRPEA